MSGRERQANWRERQRKALADAQAEIEALQARVEVLRRERDRAEGLIAWALMQERRAEERAARAEDDDHLSTASNYVRRDVVPDLENRAARGILT